MRNDAEFSQDGFRWQPQPRAAQLIHRMVELAKSRSESIRRLATRLFDQTGTRLIDWIDYLQVTGSSCVKQLGGVGFELATASNTDVAVYCHPGAIFPRIVVPRTDSGSADTLSVERLAIKVESVERYLAANGLTGNVRPEGVLGSPLRRCCVDAGGTCELWIMERHGESGFRAVDVSNRQLAAAARHSQALRNRRRDLTDATDGFSHAQDRIRAAVEDLGMDWACDLFFAAERDYWQSRNHAARVQHNRQDHLGLGWANHDHHTYRSSRECFARLVETLELLGFQCRERFYAGREAGWGAQVLEQAACGIVIFADVDMSPEEVAGDFAHQPLSPRSDLGTVGLWCRLHGEAFLQAGMHHLECQFNFDAVRQQLLAAGVETMAPFTDFPHLKQAFTAGQQWPVAESRIEQVMADGLIDLSQAERFRREGAIGSHLEILERNDGYRGFNQTGISDIIARTDPRAVS